MTDDDPRLAQFGRNLRCTSQDADTHGYIYQCEQPEGHAGNHYNASGLHGWERLVAAGTITVKLVLDATEFHAELDKVIDRLDKLGAIDSAKVAEAISRLKVGGSIAPPITHTGNSHRVL